MGVAVVIGLVVACASGITIFAVCACVAGLVMHYMADGDRRTWRIAWMTTGVAAALLIPFLGYVVWPTGNVTPMKIADYWAYFFDISLTWSVGGGASAILGAVAAAICTPRAPKEPPTFRRRRIAEISAPRVSTAPEEASDTQVFETAPESLF